MACRIPATDAPTGPGEALFLKHLDLINKVIAFVCARRHLSTADADDFGAHVLLKFVEDDYGILTSFEGRSALRTYLTVVIQRLFLDYRTSAWGKWRPSTPAKRSGELAILLERLIVRDGHSFEEACELMWTNHGVTLSRAELEAIAATLPERPRRRFVPVDELETIAAFDPTPDEVLAERERGAAEGRVREAIARAMEGFDPQDHLILTMRFEDGCTVRNIAATLRLEYKTLFRRLERLLRRLRKRLEAEGIDGTSVL